MSLSRKWRICGVNLKATFVLFLKFQSNQRSTLVLASHVQQNSCKKCTKFEKWRVRICKRKVGKFNKPTCHNCIRLKCWGRLWQPVAKATEAKGKWGEVFSLFYFQNLAIFFQQKKGNLQWNIPFLILFFSFFESSHKRKWLTSNKGQTINMWEVKYFQYSNVWSRCTFSSSIVF